MKLRYFAWVRERVGVAEEEMPLPASVLTVGDLIEYLAKQGEHYAYAFEQPATIRASIDQQHAKHDVLLAGAKEVAFFPPMTGG